MAHTYRAGFDFGKQDASRGEIRRFYTTTAPLSHEREERAAPRVVLREPWQQPHEFKDVGEADLAYATGYTDGYNEIDDAD